VSMTRMNMSAAAQLPVRFIPGDEGRKPEKGMALCLSGGGYRAMLFHVGSLWRLNELGLLPQLKRISCVSGGSITGAFLGLQWNALRFNTRGTAENFEEIVVTPLRKFARKTIDIPDVVKGVALHGTISEYVESSYHALFGTKTLQDFPDERFAPHVVINASNVQTTAIWRFSRPYMADYRVGTIASPRTPLAFVVAASSAFPPFLSPAVLRLNPSDITTDPTCDLQYPPYTRSAVLCDGGAYDNLGLETCWKRYKTILVSDACAPLGPYPQPKRDWPRQTYRLLFLIQNEVQAVRKYQLIDSYIQRLRTGAYWGIASDVSHYPLRNRLRVPLAWSTALANVPTRLAAMSPALQESLINWGYAITDTSVRSHAMDYLPRPVSRSQFPYERNAPEV